MNLQAKKYFVGVSNESFTQEIATVQGHGIDIDFVGTGCSLRPNGWSLWHKRDWVCEHYKAKPTARQIRKFIKAYK